MNLTKQQWGQIIGILLVALVALLGVFGYDTIVIQPREAAREASAPPAASWLDVSRSGTGYNTPCYWEQGGATFTCDSGGAIEINAGATLALNDGTLKFEGATADAYETTLAITDPTADRTITLPDKSGTVMLTNTPGAIVLGTNTVTTTVTISHGLTTPQTAFCTLLADSEANGATCTMTISSGTVTLKLWKADGATAGSVGKLVSWMVGGQP